MISFAFGAKYISQVSSSASPAGAASSSPSPSLHSNAPSTLSSIIPAALDGELSQHVQRLTKRDATTRLKALQSLRSLVSQKSEDDLKCMLGPWCYSFSRLVMDDNQRVRTEACAVMGVIATAARRSMAPYLKSVYPYWFLAQHDDVPDVVSAAKTSMQTAFPGEKSSDALLFCRTEVCGLTY